MDVKNCPRCGKMFTVFTANNVICPSCEKLDEEDFKIVKEFIDEHREASLNEIVSETGISLKRITKYIREGRLEITKGLRTEFRCESCGDQIATGRYCVRCFTAMKTELAEALRPNDPNRSGKMHLSSKKKRSL